jgi:hypothetical protein
LACKKIALGRKEQAVGLGIFNMDRGNALEVEPVNALVPAGKDTKGWVPGGAFACRIWRSKLGKFRSFFKDVVCRLIAKEKDKKEGIHGLLYFGCGLG